MAKGNQKVTKAKQVDDAFKDYLDVFDMLIEQAEQMNMPLLAKSMELSKAILNTYKKAWVFRVKEETKNQA